MIIYKLTSPSNKSYIGITSQTLEERIIQHTRNAGRKLRNALKKYPIEQWKKEIIDTASNLDELCNKEIYYIKLFDSFNTEHGLNLHSGGSNHIISTETRKKQSESHLGQQAWNKGLTAKNDDRLRVQGEEHSRKMLGRKASDETKKKMSEARKGKKHSEETRKKLSEQKIGNKAWLGKKHTEESKSKMRKPKTKKIC